MTFKKFNYKLKKSKYILFFALIILVLMMFSGQMVYAEGNNDNISSQLSSAVNDLVNMLDFSGLDGVISDIDSINIFDNGVEQKIKDILSGEYFTNYSSIFSAILSLFVTDVRRILPFLFSIIAIGLLSNIIGEFKSDKGSTNDIVAFVCLSAMITIVLLVFRDILDVTSSTINSILKQMQIIFPMLITMLTSIGAFSTISIYNPLVAVLTTIVGFVFEKLLYPIFILLFVFAIIGHLTDTVKLNKLTDFLSSSFKWVVGIVFTLFSGFLSIQGITAGKFDGVSIKATRFAVKSYIPIIGSYISDGMDFLVLGSVLVKNTIGIVGILILFLSIISPVITMLVVKLGLQLSSGVLELSGCNKMGSFVHKCSKIIVYPIIIILGVAFMYVITVALVMCTANIF